jgi:hypothetical protein
VKYQMIAAMLASLNAGVKRRELQGASKDGLAITTPAQSSAGIAHRDFAAIWN